MNLNEYGTKAIATLSGNYAYGDVTAQMMGQVLGLAGESGEVVEKFKKLLRDNEGKITDEDRAEIIKELGDILWYVNAVSHLLGYDLEQVAEANIQKLANRKERNVLHGSGDNR